MSASIMAPAAKPGASAVLASPAPAIGRVTTLVSLPKKVTSGSANRQRRHLEQFRTDDDEHTALHAKAQASGLRFGAFMRATALGDAGPRAQRRSSVDVTALMQALVALNRIGNNQNQTARALNELLRIAREQSDTSLETLVLELAADVRDWPALLGPPVAAILAAVRHDHEG